MHALTHTPEQYPKVVPLCNIKANMVVKELAIPFSQVGFPKQGVTDQGMSFMRERP